MVEHLIPEHGHHDIAFLAGAPEPDEREQGWREALRAHGLSDGQLVRTDYGLDGGYQAARTLVADVAISDILQNSPPKHELFDMELIIPVMWLRACRKPLLINQVRHQRAGDSESRAEQVAVA